MNDGELTPEAHEALDKVYVFLLRKRRARLAQQTAQMANQEHLSCSMATTISNATDAQVKEATERKE